jgi:GWxTD domain-containing protein
MTHFILFSEQSIVRALGWSLVHFVWQGAIIALFLALMLKLLRGRSPQLRYVVACCALGLMIVAPVITFAYLAVTARAIGHAITYAIPGLNPVMSLRQDFSGPADSWLIEFAASLDRSLPWGLTIWFSGVVFFLARFNVGLILAERMKSIATEAAPTDLQVLFHNLKYRLGIERPVRLANSALVQVPTVIGWLKPVVLIPLGCLIGLSPVQIEAIFAHELAHIHRHDYLASVAQSLAEAILFYHPAVWWVSKQMRKERENCCDDLAVSACGDSLSYAKALSILEERRSTYPIVSLGANGGALVMRIRRLLGYEETPRIPQLAGMTLLAVVIFATALGIDAFAHEQAATEKPLTTANAGASESLPVAYRKWVNEDVAWIITPEERAQFLKLTGDTERNQFIRHFWQRRDVQAAGDGKIDFRKIYYQRIAYSNEHFKTVRIPGWKSARGRIYIMYGPPDSIDAHLVASGATKPYEVWHYRTIQEYSEPEQAQGRVGYKTKLVTRNDVDMKFVDTRNCGEFQLQKSATR